MDKIYCYFSSRVGIAGSTLLLHLLSSNSSIVSVCVLSPLQVFDMPVLYLFMCFPVLTICFALDSPSLCIYQSFAPFSYKAYLFCSRFKNAVAGFHCCVGDDLSCPTTTSVYQPNIPIGKSMLKLR